MSIFEKSQLELRSNPNVFLNPMENINQRGVTDWSEVTDGEYGYDRWMKIDANTKRQPVEDIGLLKNTVYTLSYVLDGSTVSRQVISPASGHWHNSDLDVPLGATLMKLEVGSVATTFLPERPSDELSRCQRYYFKYIGARVFAHPIANSGFDIWRGVSYQLPVTLRREDTFDVTTVSPYFNNSDSLTTAVVINGRTVRFESSNCASNGYFEIRGFAIDAEIYDKVDVLVESSTDDLLPEELY